MIGALCNVARLIEMIPQEEDEIRTEERRSAATKDERERRQRRRHRRIHRRGRPLSRQPRPRTTVEGLHGREVQDFRLDHDVCRQRRSLGRHLFWIGIEHDDSSSQFILRIAISDDVDVRREQLAEPCGQRRPGRLLFVVEELTRAPIGHYITSHVASSVN